MKQKSGDFAPNFKLLNTKREWIELKELITDKKLLILFFPFAFSGT